MAKVVERLAKSVQEIESTLSKISAPNAQDAEERMVGARMLWSPLIPSTFSLLLILTGDGQGEGDGDHRASRNGQKGSSQGKDRVREGQSGEIEALPRLLRARESEDRRDIQGRVGGTSACWPPRGLKLFATFSC